MASQINSEVVNKHNPLGKQYYDQYHHDLNLGLERLFYPVEFKYPIEEKERSELIDWCYILVQKFQCNDMTFELAVSLIDRYLAKVVEDENLSLLGLSAVYLANIYTEPDASSIDDFQTRANGKSVAVIIKFCLKLLERLNYKIKTPLYHDFFSLHNHYLTYEEKHLAQYLIYSSLYSFSIIRHPPSALTSAAIWLAHLILTSSSDDDLTWYHQWFEGSSGKIPDIKVVGDLWEKASTDDQMLSILKHMGKLKVTTGEDEGDSEVSGDGDGDGDGDGEKVTTIEELKQGGVGYWGASRADIVQQMENMLQNVVFDYQRFRDCRVPFGEIELELADYRGCCFPRSATAKKEYLNKYVLSDGAYGKVFKGYRVKGDREEVAIKKFFDDDPDELSCSTLRELDAHLSFNHPSIVGIRDIYYKKKHFYLVMELCTKGDLFDYLRKKSYPTYPKKWVPQLLSAVDYLHKRNWIQRDLKTPNLLLDGDLNLKLTDFGLSRRDYYGGAKNLEERGNMAEYTPDMMTLNYRSPEMLFGDNRYDLRVDCWSVGCIIGEIYLRSYLFHGDDELEVIKNIFKALGFPSEDVEWTERYKNWYIWREHFQHLTDVRIKERFLAKNIEMPPTHWDVFLGLLQLDVEKRWHCIDCIKHIEKGGY